MKRLIESTYAQIVVTDQNLPLVFENMRAVWSQLPSPELSVVLVWIEYLAKLHQTHHWQAKGDPFYGDHLLFDRLYNETFPEIDSVAERVVGLCSAANVDINARLSQLNELTSRFGQTQTIPQPSELAKRSLVAELSFLKVVALAADALDQRGELTRGLDNLLCGIEDVHEGHVYLLRQRIS